MKNKCMLVAALLLLSGTISAKLCCRRCFRITWCCSNRRMPLYGGGKPMKAVKVTTSWDGKTYETLADKEGRWKLSVRTPEAGGPYELTLTDGGKLVLKNVMIGEVWICSGQSNMEMPLKGWGKVLDYEKENSRSQSSQYSFIALWNMLRVRSRRRISKSVIMVGRYAPPLTVPEFSATAYFFGREISENRMYPSG